MNRRLIQNHFSPTDTNSSSQFKRPEGIYFSSRPHGGNAFTFIHGAAPGKSIFAHCWRPCGEYPCIEDGNSFGHMKLIQAQVKGNNSKSIHPVNPLLHF